MRFFRLNDAVSLLRLYAIIHPDSKVAEYDFHDTSSHDLIQVFNQTKSDIFYLLFLGIYR
jgi:hypothetical protein